MKYLKSLFRFINESKLNSMGKYDIIDFFYEYLDDVKKFGEFKLNYYANLYFIRKSFTDKIIKDLEYVMLNSDDWGEKVYGDILYKDLFIDITSDEYKDRLYSLYRGSEEIIIKTEDNLSSNKLSNFDKLILNNSEKGIIPHYLIMNLSLGGFFSEDYDILLDCLLMLYHVTGWRPFDGILTEDYIDDEYKVYQYYIAYPLRLFNGSDEEYKRLCEIFLSDKSSEHPQRKLLETFL